MSKKVLKIAGRRPMLLALLIMATITIGLLFSGWLTPTPTKAQNGGSRIHHQMWKTVDNPTTTTNCAASAKLVLSNVVIYPAATTNAPYDSIVCAGDTVTATLLRFPIPSTNTSTPATPAMAPRRPTGVMTPFIPPGISPATSPTNGGICGRIIYVHGIRQMGLGAA